MNDISPAHDRDTELRHLLVATAEASPYLRPPPSRKMVIGAIAAFALAGALTGGAVSAVAVTSSAHSDQTDNARYSAEGVIGTHGRLLGTPVQYFGIGDAVLDLGTAPKGATAMVVSFDCIDRGSVIVTIDSTEVQSGTCEGVVAQEMALVGTRKHTMRIDPTGTNRYAVFASWVKEPPLPEPSAAQQAVMADGKVTRTEYLAAFNRYAGCLTAAGYPLSPVPDNYVYYSYAITDKAVSSGADARCYASEFQEVDPVWQSYVQQAVANCLTSRGVALRPQGSDLVDRLEQLLPLHLTFDQCAAEQ